MNFGTTVKNPMTRAGRYGYSKCTYCGKWYTQLGISRHWGRCPMREQVLAARVKELCNKL